MVLISVDLPEPFGPRMHTCSPAPMESVTSSSAARGPRITVTRFISIRGACTGQNPILRFKKGWPILAEVRATKNKAGIPEELGRRRKPEILASRGGVLLDATLSGRASLLCQAGAPHHSRVADRIAVRDLPPKGTSLLLFSTWKCECQR